MTAAAEELVKAASMHVQNTTLSHGRDTVQGLKTLSSDNAKLKESFETKINTVNQNISNLNTNVCALKADVAALTGKIAQQTKTQSLEWAIANVSLVDEFKYEPKKGESFVRSHGLIRDILLAFRQGEGYYIYGMAVDNSGREHFYNEEARKTGVQNFRTKLIAQIQKLTGIKPRMAAAAQGDAIFYS